MFLANDGNLWQNKWWRNWQVWRLPNWKGLQGRPGMQRLAESAISSFSTVTLPHLVHRGFPRATPGETLIISIAQWIQLRVTLVSKSRHFRFRLPWKATLCLKIIFWLIVEGELHVENAQHEAQASTSMQSAHEEKLIFFQNQIHSEVYDLWLKSYGSIIVMWSGEWNLKQNFN